MGAAVLLIAALGGGLLLVGGKRRAAGPALSSEAESLAIGAELATLPLETRQAVFRLLLTNDPANDAGVYAGAIAQLSAIPLPATARKLTQIAEERFG